jgi:hypothetical protein
LALFGVLLNAPASPTDQFRLEGAAFHTDASIDWQASTKELPATLMVYKVVPKQFSKEIITRMLEIADFTSATMKLSADQKSMEWRYRDENGSLTRSLDIAPTMGMIHYFNTKAEAPSTTLAEGVPTYDEVDRLALDYLHKLGGDTNQLALRPCSRTSGGRSTYKKRGGDLITEETIMRGAMYSRQIDGIRINGPGGRGGLCIDFGDQAKVAKLDLNWRNLHAYQRYRVVSSKQIIRLIKAGKTKLPEQDVDLAALSRAKKLTVTKLTPYYWGEGGGAAQEFTYPFAQLAITADLGGTNKMTFDLFCPIIDADPLPGQ